MKKLTVLSIFFLLAACLPAPQTQATVALAVTLTPTIIPTATISPRFAALQEQIAQSEMYTLNADGQVEMQTSEGMVIVPDILVSKDGAMTVTHEGETFEADTSTIAIDGQKITFKDKENKSWVFDGKELRQGFEVYTVGKETIINTEYNGVAVSVSLIVDQTALDVKIPSGGKEISLDNVVLNSDFKNKYGENSEKALGHAVLYAQWRAWQENVTDEVKAERKNVSFDKWVGMVKTAQETNLAEDWDKVIFQASANDLTTEKYDPEYRDFKPGGNIKIVYTNAPFDNLGVEIENITDGLQLGTSIEDNKTLIVFYGNYIKNTIYDRNQNKTAVNTSRLLARLSLDTQGSNIGKNWNDFIKLNKGSDFESIYHILTNEGDYTNVSIIMITTSK